MMRWLLALLLLVNLGLFLWIQTRIEPPQPVPTEITRPPGVREIRLLREIVRQQSTDTVLELEQDDLPDADSSLLSEPDEKMVPEAQAAESVKLAEDDETEISVMAVEQAPVCGRIGPYDDEITAKKVRRNLTGSSISVDIVVQTTEQVKKGYWVLIPTLQNRLEARQVVKKLKEAGVTDLWLFTKGPMENSISLGLYAGINNATRHSNNINSKGFHSEVNPRMSEQTKFWLEYSTSNEQALSDWVGELSADLQNEKKACE